MATRIFFEPIKFTQDPGLVINPLASGSSSQTPDIFLSKSQVVTIGIQQAMDVDSSVVFNSITMPTSSISPTAQFTIDNGLINIQETLISNVSSIVGNLNITENYTSTEDLTVKGTITADSFISELTQSVTLFKSGSTLFGDTSDDTHQRTGSLSISGSYLLNVIAASFPFYNNPLNEISNDTTLATSAATSIVTENAVKTYLDEGAGVFQTYQRKSFAHTGSFVSVSTASFTATTASAPTGYTATTEADFMFFVNGVIAEYDALTVQQSGTSFLLKVNNDSIGYDLQTSDEIVAFGKFNS